MSTGTTKHRSPDQVASFWRQGYLVLEKMLDDAELKVLRDSVKVLEAWAQLNSQPDFQREVDSTSAPNCSAQSRRAPVYASLAESVGDFRLR